MNTLIPLTDVRPEEPTAREREILDLIWAGLTNQDIAARLGIASKTVESHRANLMRKFRVSNTAQLLRVALLEGVLQVNDAAQATKPPRRLASSK